MTRSLNTTSAVPVKNGNGTRAKSAIACAIADLIDAVIAHDSDADVSAIVRVIAKATGVCPQAVGNARRISAEQREAVRRGARPLIVPNLSTDQIAALLANGGSHA
jgi:hypothetical protein